MQVYGTFYKRLFRLHSNLEGNSSPVKVSQPCNFLPGHRIQSITDSLLKGLGNIDFDVCQTLCSVFVHEGCKNAQEVGIYRAVHRVEIVCEMAYWCTRGVKVL